MKIRTWVFYIVWFFWAIWSVIRAVHRQLTQWPDYYNAAPVVLLWGLGIALMAFFMKTELRHARISKMLDQQLEDLQKEKEGR